MLYGLNSGLIQCLKPLLIEILITEFTVEALDIAVLHDVYIDGNHRPN